MLSANYNYQYIDWSHDPIPGENFDHLGNLVTNVITPSITIGLSNYLNLTIKQAIGMRYMDWMGPGNSSHHRDETTLSSFNNADGGVLGNTDVLMKYLFTNTGSDSGSRIFFGLGLTIPSKSVLTKSPYLTGDNGEALEDHRHFSLSDGCYKVNYELQYYIKGSPQVSFLPSFYGLTLNYFNPIDESKYGFKPGSSLVGIMSFLFTLNNKNLFYPKGLNVGLIYIKDEVSTWNGEKSPINSTIVFAPTLGINWTHDRMGSLNLNFRFMVNAPLQSDKLNNKSNAMGISIGYRKILDYSIPWLYW